MKNFDEILATCEKNKQESVAKKHIEIESYSTDTEYYTTFMDAKEIVSKNEKTLILLETRIWNDASGTKKLDFYNVNNFRKDELLKVMRVMGVSDYADLIGKSAIVKIEVSGDYENLIVLAEADLEDVRETVIKMQKKEKKKKKKQKKVAGESKETKKSKKLKKKKANLNPALLSDGDDLEDESTWKYAETTED